MQRMPKHLVEFVTTIESLGGDMLDVHLDDVETLYESGAQPDVIAEAQKLRPVSWFKDVIEECGVNRKAS